MGVHSIVVVNKMESEDDGNYGSVPGRSCMFLQLCEIFWPSGHAHILTVRNQTHTLMMFTSLVR